MNKEDLLNNFKNDIDHLTSAPITNPMNTQHALMFEAYELGAHCNERLASGPSVRKIPKPKPVKKNLRPRKEPSPEAILRRRIDTYLKSNKQVAVYEVDGTYKLRNKRKPNMEHDVYTTYKGTFTNAPTAMFALLES